MIYVDELRDYGPKGKFCHMWTDGDMQELNQFASNLGLKPNWIHHSQGISGKFSHYDLVPSKRERALKQGAQYMPLKQWVAERMKGCDS